jgi:probable addiction module antidote protein
MDESERSEADTIERINRALASSDIKAFGEAIRDVVKLHNASDIARKAGLERTSFYRAFGTKQKPNFTTVLGVLGAIGLELKVQKKSSRK